MAGVNLIANGPRARSRARGALLGLVAGNQLGVPTEHLGTPEAIRKAFPNGVWDLASAPKNSPYDDDAAMTLLLRGIAARVQGIRRHRRGASWVKWMKVDGRGIGVTTRRALTLIDRGKGRSRRQVGPPGEPPEVRRQRERDALRPRRPAISRRPGSADSNLDATVGDHASDERCTWGAAAVNLAVRELLHGNIYFVDEVLHRLRDRAPRALVEAIHRVAARRAGRPAVVAGDRLRRAPPRPAPRRTVPQPVQNFVTK